MQKKKESVRPEDMPYIYERVVAKHRHRQLKRVLWFVACAALFGCIAGCCLLFVMRFKTKDPVVMAVDSQTELQRSSTKTQSVSERIQSNSPLYGYFQVRDSFVTVSTIYGTGDWMDDEPTVTGTTETFGVIVAENLESYYILTSADVIEKAETVYVELNGQSIEAGIHAKNRVEGIAVVSILKEELPNDAVCSVAVLGSSKKLQQGDTVIAAGSPYAFAGSVNYGHVTYMGSEETYDRSMQMIYTDMTAAAESSGVLLNQNGEIVGWIIKSREESLSGMISAAAIEELHQTISLLMEGESVAYLGIGGQEITEEISDTHGIPEGFYITIVAEDSPAKLAGLQPGDILITVNGQPIKKGSQLGELLSSMEVDESVAVELKRMVQGEYESMTIEAVLGER